MKVSLLSPAAEEIARAIERQRERAPEAARALEAELDRSIGLIVENPLIGSVSPSDTRRVLLRRFPYSVVYRVLEDRLLVVAFAHHRRAPNYWTKRL